MLSSTQLKRLPSDPIGFLPLVAQGTTSIETAHRALFLPIIVKELTFFPSVREGFIEILASEKEAQMLLEFYLTQLPPSVGIGAVRSLALVDVFVCLARFQVALPGKLAETIYRILLQIGVLPRIRYYQTQPSKLARLGQQHFRMIGIVGPSDRQKVGDLSQFLKTMREKLPPARI